MRSLTSQPEIQAHDLLLDRAEGLQEVRQTIAMHGHLGADTPDPFGLSLWQADRALASGGASLGGGGARRPTIRAGRGIPEASLDHRAAPRPLGCLIPPQGSGPPVQVE